MRKKHYMDIMMAAMMLSGSDAFDGGVRQMRDERNHTNPHNFPRFETDGFATYSINQAAHDAKYQKYLKKKNKSS